MASINKWITNELKLFPFAAAISPATRNELRRTKNAPFTTIKMIKCVPRVALRMLRIRSVAAPFPATAADGHGHGHKEPKPKREKQEICLPLAVGPWR